MRMNNETKMTICTAPPELYAVIKNINEPPNNGMLDAIRIVTAFRYTYGNDNTVIFSEPLIQCKNNEINALVNGQLKVEFVGSLENCELKIKKMISTYYTEKYAERDRIEMYNKKIEKEKLEMSAMEKTEVY